MHKTHCGHAKASVHFLGKLAYLSGINDFIKRLEKFK